MLYTRKLFKNFPYMDIFNQRLFKCGQVFFIRVEHLVCHITMHHPLGGGGGGGGGGISKVKYIASCST